MEIDWKRKLASRKFWTAIASFVSMIIVALGGTESSGAQAAALIMAGASVVAYIIGEGLIDAAGAMNDKQTDAASQEVTKPPEDTDDGK